MMRRAISRPEFFVVDLGGRVPGDDLNECLKVRCSNMTALRSVTGISYYKLRYFFVEKGGSYYVGDGFIILKSSTLYRGSQPGGLRNTSNNALLK